LLFVLLNIAVFLLRAVSIGRYGALFASSGAEPLAIYPVWKAVHHLPAYGWPLAFPFSLALYNYLFYYGYAFFLRLVGASGADILPWGRLFTAGFAMMGAIAQWKLVQSHLKLRGACSALSLFFAVGLWYCASMVSFWAVSIRPDMAAVAVVMAALWIVVRQPRFAFAYAGVLFYLAWSFKQSVILALAGVCIFLLLHKRWRDLALLAAVFAALVSATLLLGSPEYRYNILVAPRLVREFSLMHAFSRGERALIENAYWILTPAVLIFAAGARRLDNTVRLLITVLAMALVGGLAGMTKSGGADNYLLEAFVAGSTLLQIAIFTAPGRLTSLVVLLNRQSNWQRSQPAPSTRTLP
jgi:cytochrome c oxidase subunit IV